MKRVTAPPDNVTKDMELIIDPLESVTKRKKTDESDMEVCVEVSTEVIKEGLIARDPLPSGGIGDIEMQWVDMDMYSGSPLAEHPVPGKQIPGNRVGDVPVIRIFGVTKQGFSIMAHVHGVTPYFYCECPSDSFPDEDISKFRQVLDEKVMGAARVATTCVVAVIPVMKQNFMGYTQNILKKYLKVFVTMPAYVAKARTILQSYFRCPGYAEREFLTFESNVPFVLRYMVDNEIVGGNWLEMKDGSYLCRNESEKVSRCQLEVDIVYEEVISHPPTIPKHSILAPLRILSFDIECKGRRGFFPDHEKDPVIQIASYLTVQGEKDARLKVVMVLDTCLPIVGAQVMSFEKEEDLLLAWSSFVRESDPDIFTGYNIQNFDFPYLVGRAHALKIGNKFAELGKLKKKVAKISKSTFSSSAYGTRENQEIELEGRVVMDMILYMYRNHKMSSYSLNAVSSEFLGQQKEDVHHSIISDLQNGTPEDRRRLAVYCLKDAYLPQQLMDKLFVLFNYVEMARVTGVPIPFLFSRGQQIKVLSMIYRKAKDHNMIIPVYRRMGGGDENGDVGYEGATVIEPIKGFYDEPIATLDFASLYPSIMMAHNLCYTTLLKKEDLPALEENVDYKKSPTGDHFISSSKQKGILPTILEELLSARKRAKKDMKNATDPLVQAVMNGRQLALKISANSVYGFTGATVGSLPCLAISASVTSYGRDMINQTKEGVESTFTIANGYPADAKVIYGDTDSVMVKFGVKTVKEAMDLGLQAANELTKSLFVKPIALEFEKIYYPYLLMNKKRYAGMYWTNPDKYDKMDCKGIETVRRDNCGLVRTVIGTCLRKILIDHSVDDAVAYTKETIAALLQNKVDISLLIITKSLSGKSEDYANKQAHVELAKRMRERDAGSAPVVGDRVPYVIIQKAKNTPAYLKSEDPIYVLENNIPIDFQYYLHQQLSKPLLRIFSSVLSHPESLLCGDHTRSIYKATPSASIGIMKFTVKKAQCLGCKTPIDNDKKGGLCDHCDVNRASLYLDRLGTVNELEERFSKLWTQCQRCQGSLHQDVICTSRDCPIFYMRKKVQKDLHVAQDKVVQFSDF